MEVDFWLDRLSFFILYLWLCLHFFKNEDVRPRKLSVGGGDRLYQPTVRRICAIVSSILYHSGDSTRDKCGAQQNFHADSIRVSRYFILGANNLHDFSALLNNYQAREARTDTFARLSNNFTRKPDGAWQQPIENRHQLHIRRQRIRTSIDVQPLWDGGWRKLLFRQKWQLAPGDTERSRRVLFREHNARLTDCGHGSN